MDEMKLPPLEPKVELFSKFLREFQSETDRGAAMLAASLLDDKLKAVIESFLVDCSQSLGLLEGYNAPIGTFSARLNLACALGLISEVEYRNCNLVRKIRNDFAHKFALDFSFNDKRISQLCWEIDASTPGDKQEFKDNPRFLFVNGVVQLCLDWMYREEYVSKKRLTRPNWTRIVS